MGPSPPRVEVFVFIVDAAAVKLRSHHHFLLFHFPQPIDFLQKEEGNAFEYISRLNPAEATFRFAPALGLVPASRPSSRACRFGECARPSRSTPVYRATQKRLRGRRCRRSLAPGSGSMQLNFVLTKRIRLRSQRWYFFSLCSCSFRIQYMHRIVATCSWQRKGTQKKLGSVQLPSSRHLQQHPSIKGPRLIKLRTYFCPLTSPSVPDPD